MYTIVYTAPQGGECVTKCRPQFLTTLIFQCNRSRRSHFGFMGSACSCNIRTWNLDLPQSPSYLVRKFPCPSSNRRYLPQPPHRPSSLLAYHLSCVAFTRIPVPDPQSTQNDSTRRDVLFPGYIHISFRTRDVSIIRKGKDIGMVLYLLFAICLDLHSLYSTCFPPCKW